MGAGGGGGILGVRRPWAAECDCDHATLVRRAMSHDQIAELRATSISMQASLALMMMTYIESGPDSYDSYMLNVLAARCDVIPAS